MNYENEKVLIKITLVKATKNDKIEPFKILVVFTPMSLRSIAVLYGAGKIPSNRLFECFNIDSYFENTDDTSVYNKRGW